MTENTREPAESSDGSLESRTTKQALVHARAKALALLCGRPLEELSMEDYLQARLEAAGEEGDAAKILPVMPVSESEHWTADRGGGGSQAAETEQEEEAEEGRSLGEQDALRGQTKACLERRQAAAEAAHRETQN